jgi:hypothetical protein
MPNRDRTTVDQELSQILGGSDATDLLGSVIRSDRRKSGRAAPVADHDTMTSQPVIKQYDKLASTQPDQRTSGEAGKPVSPEAVGQADAATEERPGASTARREGRRQQADGANDLLEGRTAEARRMAESPTTTVTLRIPRELNDWLDEYIHRAWREKVRKQDLVSEGLRLVFARRGRPGEPILPTALFPEESP